MNLKQLWSLLKSFIMRVLRRAAMVWSPARAMDSLAFYLLVGVAVRLYYALLRGMPQLSAIHAELQQVTTILDIALSIICIAPYEVTTGEMVHIFPLTVYHWGISLFLLLLMHRVYGVEPGSWLYALLSLRRKKQRVSTASVVDKGDEKGFCSKKKGVWFSSSRKAVLKIILRATAKRSPQDALNVACLSPMSYNMPEIQNLLAVSERWHALETVAHKLRKPEMAPDMFHTHSYALVLGIAEDLPPLGEDHTPIKWHVIDPTTIKAIDTKHTPGVMYLDIRQPELSPPKVVVISSLDCDKDKMMSPWCFLSKQECAKHHERHFYYYAAPKQPKGVPSLLEPFFQPRGFHSMFYRLVSWWDKLCNREELYYDAPTDQWFACTDIIFRVTAVQIPEECQ